MIKDYADKDTRKFAEGQRVKRFSGFEGQAKKRLVLLDVAESLREVGQIRGNALESLSGKRKGQHSIRINSQWRICFKWPEHDDGPSNVEIVDYH